MREHDYNLAIEMSGRDGAVALGRGDEMIAVAELAQRRRHNIELIPTIDRLFREHGLTPRRLAEVYVSLGPGSFTGLRIAAATAKMLALAGEVKLVGVPTLEALRAEHPDAIVCLNIKRDTAYCAGPGLEPAIRGLDDLSEPVVKNATPRVETIHRLGRERGKRGRFDDPATLIPLYIREPEAVTLWNKRHSPP